MAPRRRRTVVPGSFLGYSIQVTRLVHHLVRAGPGDSVCLELLGDTAVLRADGRLVVEESKTRTGRGNPIANHAVDLWKTFRNWVEAVASGEMDPDRTRFVVWVSRRFAGSIAHSFDSADTIENAISAREAARRVLARMLGGTSEAAEHARVVFEADPDLVGRIIQNFRLEFGSGMSLNDLRSQVEAKWISPDVVDDVLTYMFGWVKVRVDKLLEKGEPAVIDCDCFSREASSFARVVDQNRILNSFAPEPTEEDTAEHLRTKVYVRQLDLIEIEHDEKLRAVSDYLKAEADRIHWAEAGRVHESSFIAFEADLTDAWRNHRLRCETEHRPRAEAERGVLLFTSCCGHLVPINGIATPQHFCRGSFHALADRQVVGWHPRYREILEKAIGLHGDDAQ